jgi:phosphoglucosamine mutase
MKKKQKYFGTDGIRGKVGEPPITPEFILKLGWAFGRVLARRGGASKVLIGKDTRISGYMFEAALESGLVAAGANIYLLGPLPTPAIAYLTRTLRASAGIVISASHNPFYDNGIKFFSAGGTKLPDEIEIEIEAQLEKPLQIVDAADLGSAERLIDAPGRYIEFCKNILPHHTTLDGIKLVIDCANGATCRVAPYIFRELGAKVIELSTHPDGFNINNQCGSTHMEHLQETVLTHHADLGIAFDGDGDRVLMVDEKGERVDGDDMIYIIAKAMLAKKQLMGGVIGTQMSNMGLEVALQQLGLEFARSEVGDRYVLDLLQKNNWILGGEPSGHIICLDVATTGDGVIAALRVLAALLLQEKSLQQLKKGVTKYPQVMINVARKNHVNPLMQPEIKKAITAAEKKLAGKGRVLVRLSGTEAVVRVMVEGENEATITELANDLTTVIRKAA